MVYNICLQIKPTMFQNKAKSMKNLLHIINTSLCIRVSNNMKLFKYACQRRSKDIYSMDALIEIILSFFGYDEKDDFHTILSSHTTICASILEYIFWSSPHYINVGLTYRFCFVYLILYYI